MIQYDNNTPWLICRIEGSNIPRALWYSFPSVALAVVASCLIDTFSDYFAFIDDINVASLWSSSMIILSVLLAMRTAKAYDRFWEGITLVQLMRAEWFEAASNLIAFSFVATKSDPLNESICSGVRKFQFTLVRLLSLLHGKALKSVGGNEEEFEVLDVQALDAVSLAFLRNVEVRGDDPVEVLVHWIQVLVTDAHLATSLPVPPPILTRVYQTISRGMVHFHNARKLAECPFPFPLSQMVYVLLIFQALVIPLILAAALGHPALSGCATFLTTMGMWSITFSAGELEQPFGNDPNDLPLSEIQKAYNKSLIMLLEKESFNAPLLTGDPDLNVKSLRKKHTVNTQNDWSMTDSLPEGALEMACNRQDSENTWDGATHSAALQSLRRTSSRKSSKTSRSSRSSRNGLGHIQAALANEILLLPGGERNRRESACSTCSKGSVENANICEDAENVQLRVPLGGKDVEKDISAGNNGSSTMNTLDHNNTLVELRKICEELDSKSDCTVLQYAPPSRSDRHEHEEPGTCWNMCTTTPIRREKESTAEMPLIGSRRVFSLGDGVRLCDDRTLDNFREWCQASSGIASGCDNLNAQARAAGYLESGHISDSVRSCSDNHPS